MSLLTIKTETGETKSVSLAKGETVLDGMLNAGFDVAYGCKSGACHSCLLQSPDLDRIPNVAQKGLRSIEQSQGYFLSCKCLPEESITIHLDGVHERYLAQVLELDQIANNVWRLRLSKEMAYRPGQFLNLKHQSGVTRSYSIASHPIHDDFLECHIRAYPDGKFSQLIESELKVGDQLELSGPYGNCVYENNDKTRTLLLSGLGLSLIHI